MHNLRRRDHRQFTTHDAIRDLLARTLRSYRATLDLHPCESCEVDLSIFEREAKRLGLE